MKKRIACSLVAALAGAVLTLSSFTAQADWHDSLWLSAPGPHTFLGVWYYPNHNSTRRTRSRNPFVAKPHQPQSLCTGGGMPTASTWQGDVPWEWNETPTCPLFQYSAGRVFVFQ